MRSKFKNQPITLNGLRFMSRAEAGRYVELRKKELAGEITRLELQVKFKFGCGRTYIADFVYFENGTRIVEDVKGMRTEVYKIKRDMMRHEFGVKIRETKMHPTSAAMLIAGFVGEMKRC